MGGEWPWQSVTWNPVLRVKGKSNSSFNTQSHTHTDKRSSCHNIRGFSLAKPLATEKKNISPLLFVFKSSRVLNLMPAACFEMARMRHPPPPKQRPALQWKAMLGDQSNQASLVDRSAIVGPLWPYRALGGDPNERGRAHRAANGVAADPFGRPASRTAGRSPFLRLALRRSRRASPRQSPPSPLASSLHPFMPFVSMPAHRSLSGSNVRDAMPPTPHE